MVTSHFVFRNTRCSNNQNTLRRGATPGGKLAVGAGAEMIPFGPNTGAAVRKLGPVIGTATAMALARGHRRVAPWALHPHVWQN